MTTKPSASATTLRRKYAHPSSWTERKRAAIRAEQQAYPLRTAPLRGVWQVRPG